MMLTHSQAVQVFARRLKLLFFLRAAVQVMALWFFIWGVAVLAVRIYGGTQSTGWLALGGLGVVPMILFAAVREHRRQPAFAKIRASYDRLNACGGVVMAEEVAAMDAWESQLPVAAVPKFRWHNGRAMLWLCLSALFVETALLLPERLTHFSSHRSLEIGQIVGELQAEVQTLREEKIVDEKNPTTWKSNFRICKRIPPATTRTRPGRRSTTSSSPIPTRPKRRRKKRWPRRRS